VPVFRFSVLCCSGARVIDNLVYLWGIYVRKLSVIRVVLPRVFLCKPHSILGLRLISVLYDLVHFSRVDVHAEFNGFLLTRILELNSIRDVEAFDQAAVELLNWLVSVVLYGAINLAKSKGPDHAFLTTDLTEGLLVIADLFLTRV